MRLAVCTTLLYLMALKISATLALIGAIVAEYFGSPTRGMGFRISTGVGRLDMDLVWAEIFRCSTGWHRVLWCGHIG